VIRPFTCVCLLLAAGSGLYLYQTKHQTQMVDREIERTLKMADATWQRGGVLRAEYTLLNDPSRLSDLAGQYLPALQTTAPGQFSTIADLDHRLPPVGPPPADPAPPDAPVAAAAPPPDTAAPEPARPDTSRVETARLEPAHTEPPRPDPPHLDPPKVVAAPPPRPAPPAPAADPAPRPVVIAPPRVTPAPTISRSVLAPPTVTNVVARTEPAPPVAPTEQVARVSTPAPPGPMVGSALGMARTMAAPPANSAPQPGSLR
jgi:hypothetical protein